MEKLLAAMSFKQHNKYVRRLRAKLESQTNYARKKFDHCHYYTHVPYPGPNVRGYCDPKCEILEKSKDVDRRMFNILNMYEQAAKSQLRDKHREFQKRRSVEGIEQKAAGEYKNIERS